MLVPRQYSLVKVKDSAHQDVKDYFEDVHIIIFLGEIPNMIGHCVISADDTTLISFHTDDFQELSEDEV